MVARHRNRGYGVVTLSTASTSREQSREQDRARLTSERALLGRLSRRDLALEIGVHFTYVAAIMRGERRPSAEVAVRWADYLDVTVAVFMQRLKKLTGGEVVRREWMGKSGSAKRRKR